jgi:hypothetical protein
LLVADVCYGSPPSRGRKKAREAGFTNAVFLYGWGSAGTAQTSVS